jgi:hypothetical protein
MKNSNALCFDSRACERRFRLALDGIKSKAFIERAGDSMTLFLRPDDLLAFGHALNAAGM